MRSVLTYILVCFVLSVICVSINAQPVQSQDGKSFIKLNTPDLSLKRMSLLDPKRFSMKQETVMSYSSSGRYGNNLMGMYINTMEYRFNMPLTFRMRVAYQNNMGSLFSNQASGGVRPGEETGRLFIPSFDMFYQPWKNTIISFHYRDYSGMTPNEYGDRFSPYRYPYFMR